MIDEIELITQSSNLILAALPSLEYARMFSNFEFVPLVYGEILYKPADLISHVYFPESGIISLLASAEEHSTHSTLEVGIVGNEGMVGLPTFLGVEVSQYQAVVQGAGSAIKMKTEDLQSECKNGGLLTALLQRFTHSLLTQVSQSAACYRFHIIESRFARWLLMTSDRMNSNNFNITQEFLSNMLGVRREAVNRSAANLQHQQLISFTRGKISIIDREGLEKIACECYTIIKTEEKSFPVH